MKAEREKRALILKKEGKNLDQITEILISENLIPSNICSPKERTRQILAKAERLARKNQ